MNKQIEALKMAIEAMNDAGFFIDGDVGYPIFFEKAIKACKEALSEAEKQEWQSLSDDEIKEITENLNSPYAQIRTAEIMLKEKNHGRDN